MNVKLYIQHITIIDKLTMDIWTHKYEKLQNFYIRNAKGKNPLERACCVAVLHRKFTVLFKLRIHFEWLGDKQYNAYSLHYRISKKEKQGRLLYLFLFFSVI